MEETTEQTTEQTQQSPAVSASLKGKAEDIFRGLWASLFYSGRVGGKTVLTCSADRREGASTIACGLALAGSDPEGASRVALVDLNLRHPAVHKLLGLKEGPGVAEIVLEGNDPASAAQSVSGGLDVYTCGNAAGRSLAVLRNPRLAEFLAQLVERYDYVLIDAAPANPFPDAQVLAGIVKDVLLVARTEQTPREAVALAKKRLESGGARIAGVVLNLRTYPIPRFLYRRV